MVYTKNHSFCNLRFKQKRILVNVKPLRQRSEVLKHRRDISKWVTHEKRAQTLPFNFHTSSNCALFSHSAPLVIPGVPFSTTIDASKIFHGKFREMTIFFVANFGQQWPVFAVISKLCWSGLSHVNKSVSQKLLFHTWLSESVLLTCHDVFLLTVKTKKHIALKYSLHFGRVIGRVLLLLLLLLSLLLSYSIF